MQAEISCAVLQYTGCIQCCSVLILESVGYPEKVLRKVAEEQEGKPNYCGTFQATTCFTLCISFLGLI